MSLLHIIFVVIKFLFEYIYNFKSTLKRET